MARKRIDEHTLKVLEFTQVRDWLASYTASPLGRQEALRIYPSTDPDWIRQRLAETTEMKNLLEKGHRLPLAGISDITPILSHLETAQTLIEPQDLLAIEQTLSASAHLKQFFTECDEPIVHLKAMALTLEFFDDLTEPIRRSIDGDGNVRDHASDRLRDIRRRMHDLQQHIQQKFQRIISSPDLQPAIENDNVLTRHGRAVLAVRENYRQRVPGMVLDRSNTGATLYIEPYELAELSNELEETLSEEKREVNRILFELTHHVLHQTDRIQSTLRALAHIDTAFAKARLSLDFQCHPPAVTPHTSLRLRDARHPLLLNMVRQRLDNNLSAALKTVVPLDVRLGEDFDLLLITGPNTGGKTVGLKTIGLLVLMAQAGLHIPARADAQLPVYRQIFADIGDEQSIEQSLSTFSAHMKQIIHILSRANEYSLVLLDELGAGTDPAEGALLGIALLDELLNLKSHTVATTHLGRLKTFAYTASRAENASMTFDPDTLEPTYQLRIGTPGVSNALAIVERLGMPKSVLKKARHQRHQRRDDGDLVQQLEKSRTAAEEKRSESEAVLQQARAVRLLAHEKLQLAHAAQQQAHRRADQEIDRTMRDVIAIVRRFVRDMHNVPKPFNDHVLQLQADIAHLASATSLAQRQQQFVAALRPGDRVYVSSLNTEGMVQKIHNKRCTITILMQGREVETPFEDIWSPPDPKSLPPQKKTEGS